MEGFGGVVTFSLKVNEKQTSRFIDSLEIPYIATNFCGPQSLIEQHAVLTFTTIEKRLLDMALKVI